MGKIKLAQRFYVKCFPVYMFTYLSLHQVTPPTPRETFSSTMATEAVPVIMGGS